MTGSSSQASRVRHAYRWVGALIVVAVVGVGTWMVWPENATQSRPCPGESQDSKEQAQDIGRKDELDDAVSELAYSELKRLYMKDGEWMLDKDSNIQWSKDRARAHAAESAVPATDEYDRLAKAHCKGGAWDKGWSEERVYEAALDKGKEEVARLEEETS